MYFQRKGYCVPYLGEIASLATAVCWSFTSIFFSAAGRRIGSLQVNLYRLPIAVLLLAAAYVVSTSQYDIPTKPIIWLAISGVIGLSIGDTFLFRALVLIGARLSMLLLSLVPPITAILAYVFLGETLNFAGILGIIVTVSGVSWVVAERTPSPTGEIQKISGKGIFAGIMGAVGQAVGLIFAKQGLSYEIHPILATLMRMTAATIVLWPVVWVMGKVVSARKLISHNRDAIKYFIGGVIAGPFVGVTLSLVSIKYTNTGVAATLMATVPVIMLPLVVLIEKEYPTWRAVTGAVIAVIGVAIIFLR